MIQADTVGQRYHIRRTEWMRAIPELIHPRRCSNANEIINSKVSEYRCNIPGTDANLRDAKTTIRAILIEIFSDHRLLVITEFSSNEEDVKQWAPEELRFIPFGKFVVWKSFSG